MIVPTTAWRLSVPTRVRIESAMRLSSPVAVIAADRNNAAATRTSAVLAKPLNANASPALVPYCAAGFATLGENPSSAKTVVARPTEHCRTPIAGKRRRNALSRVALDIAANELFLLAPGAPRPGEDPGGTDITVIAEPGNNGGIPVIGERNRVALEGGIRTERVRGNELRLFAPRRTRAREYPSGADTAVVVNPTDDSSAPVAGERHREALLCWIRSDGVRSDELRLLSPHAP